MSSQAKRVRVEFEGVGVFRAELKRFMAPLTYDEVVRRLPLSGPAARWDFAVYVPVEIRRGAEKEIYSASPGDVLYWATNGSIVFVFRKAQPPTHSVRIGVILDDPSPLERVRPGSRVLIAPE
ncbi:MAG: cyclophilin-like fold protein [Nitrososphaeria archaeon]|nr:cyclophilin-like fold protein [Nitrososphaeria archaeon]MDW8043315.1 cyclophilin-like fold protein [Nitrososphaerota archaeon]